jgi:8-oxo-dGTP pyrophosphatase MutT (NUDIX family)
MPTPKPAIRVRISALISNKEGKILLLERLGPKGKVQYLHLPGGGCKPGEAYLEALSRELREETGYEILPPPKHDQPRLIWVRQAKRGPELIFHARNGVQKKLRRTRREAKTLGQAVWVDPEAHWGPPIKPAELSDPIFRHKLLRSKGALLTLSNPSKS